MPNSSALAGMLGGLIVRQVRIAPRDVVFLKGVIEASEGVAAVFAESGGDLTIATLPTQKNELDRILQDLREETGALLDCNDDTSTGVNDEPRARGSRA